MATVLIQHGGSGDGDLSPPPARAFFQLIEGKLHLPTIRDYFKLINVRLNNIVYATDAEGFTFNIFVPNDQIRVTGDPMPVSRQTRLLLIKTGEVFTEGDNGKRRVEQLEENLGLWPLPPPESQPRTIAELTQALRSFLQADQNTTWMFKYRYFGELVPIRSDRGLEDEESASQHCKLYLIVVPEETASRELIRARITGILDAAVAQTSNVPPHSSSGVGALPIASAGLVDSSVLQAMAQAHAQAQAQAQAQGGTYAGYSDGAYDDQVLGADGDGDDDGSPPPGRQGGKREPVPKKESKTRQADGRFKNESQHVRKMADMSRKIAELFDGTIVNLVDIVDHKKIKCNLCAHMCTAYSAYHTDCVRKHYLRHHEAQLKERGVDVNKWRKEYEMSQKVRKALQHQGHLGQNGLGSRASSGALPQGLQAGGLPLHDLDGQHLDLHGQLNLNLLMGGGSARGDGPGASGDLGGALQVASTMGRLASGTVTTEMVQPPVPPAAASSSAPASSSQPGSAYHVTTVSLPVASHGLSAGDLSVALGGALPGGSSAQTPGSAGGGGGPGGILLSIAPVVITTELTEGELG